MERLMLLQKYVRELRPRNESYTPPVDKIQKMFSEAYNIPKGGSVKISESTANEVEQIIRGLGYETKTTKVQNRLSVVEDKRAAAIEKILDATKNMGAVLLKTPQAIKISSMGIIQIGNIQIVVKPKTKNTLQAENNAVDALVDIIQKAVEQEAAPITVNIGNYKINNVVTAGSKQIRGNPKADMALIDDRNIEVGFVSHKKEGGAAAFQQYGGISKKAGEVIADNILVTLYIKDLNDLLIARNGSSTAKNGFSALRRITRSKESEELIARSVYGPSWNNGAPNTFNRQSVHCIGQGTPILKREDDGLYTLTFSEASHYANDISWAFSGNYMAVFASTFRLGRNTEYKDVKITNLRSGIYPYLFVMGRSAEDI